MKVTVRRTGTALMGLAVAAVLAAGGQAAFAGEPQARPAADAAPDPNNTGWQSGHPSAVAPQTDPGNTGWQSAPSLSA